MIPDEAVILWQNDTWAVTDIGLEHRGRVDYVIPKKDLLEVRPGDRVSRAAAWPQQLADKTWLADLEAFIVAFEAAVRIHHPEETGAIDLAAGAAQARTRRRIILAERGGRLHGRATDVAQRDPRSSGRQRRSHTPMPAR